MSTDHDDDTRDFYHNDKDPSSSNPQDPSQYDNVVEIHGVYTKDCKICHKDKSRISYDMIADKLAPSIYQQLLDRGWGRDGNYFYFPPNMHTCCPKYSISCDTIKFELSKSQMKCIDKLYAYLIDDSCQSSPRISSQINKKNLQKATEKKHSKQGVKDIKDHFDNLKQGKEAKDAKFVAACERAMRRVKRNNITDLEEAIQMIRDKPQEVHKPELTIEDCLYPRKANLEAAFLKNLKPKHKLQVRLVHVNSKEFQGIRQKEHDFLTKLHGATGGKLSAGELIDNFEKLLTNSPITAENMQDRDYIPSEGDSTTNSFCVDVFTGSEDEFALVKPPPLPTHFGTYHCLYFIDDELVGVGGFDILPKCLSTFNLLFFDRKYLNFNLPVYATLVEISIVREMFKHYRGPADKNELKQYNLGFYTHQDKETHYKTSYKPSYMLCPITHHYRPVAKCLSILNKGKYARLGDEIEVESEPTISLVDLFRIPVSAPVLENSTKMIEYFRWVKSNASHKDVEGLAERSLVPYAAAIGPNLLSRILVRLHAVHRARFQRPRDSFNSSWERKFN